MEETVAGGTSRKQEWAFVCHPFVPGGEARAAFLQHTRKERPGGSLNLSVIIFVSIVFHLKPSLRYDYPLNPPNTASRPIRDVGKRSTVH